MFEIEKNVPVPEERTRYPLGKMEVTDSFLAMGKAAYSARSAAHKYGKNHGKKFKTRTVEGGMRIWRVE